MSRNIQQIFSTNPASSMTSTDLFYLGRSPYGLTDDFAITWANVLSSVQAQATGTWAINISGNAATVTTNANLTGDVTSVGNSTTYAGVVPVPKGGTGKTTFTAYSVICAGTTATGVFQNVVGLGASGEQLTSNGPGSLPTWQAGGTVSPLTTKGDLYTFTTVNARLAVGTINGQILQVNSGTATGLAWSTATYPSTALNAARILRSDGTNYVDTTSTFADTYAASGFLYANGANNVAGLATANNGVPVTSNTGVPSILSGPGTTGNFLQSNAAAAPSWSAATFPSSGGASGNILISNGTNYIASTSLWPNTVGTNLHILLSNGTSNIYSTPAYPNASVTAGKLIISDGTDYVASTSVWPNTVGSAGKIVRSDGTVNAYTTSTFADTYTASNLLYSNGANTVTGLATANNGVLITSSGGVPSISSTLPQAVLNNIPVPTVQKFTSGSGTYTTPANCKYFRVLAVAGGGGGAGSGTTNGGGQSAGGDTTFGSIISLVGGSVGSPGVFGGSGGGGGAVTTNTASPGGMAVAGGGGQGGNLGPTSTGVLNTPGGMGGSSMLGGAANSASTSGAVAGQPNSGGGGSGGACTGAAPSGGGGGGGAGCDVLVASPAATYAYAVGAGGSAGAAGTSGQVGTAGGSGVIVVYEFYV